MIEDPPDKVKGVVTQLLKRPLRYLRRTVRCVNDRNQAQDDYERGEAEKRKCNEH